jgi:hypothetical protein
MGQTQVILLAGAGFPHTLLAVTGLAQELLAGLEQQATNVLLGKLGVTQPVKECDLRLGKRE